jgi:hypothetical protein
MAETGDPAARGWGDRTGEDMSGNGVRARSGVACSLFRCPDRSSVDPMETYLRLMFLKFRYRLGYELLCYPARRIRVAQIQLAVSQCHGDKCWSALASDRRSIARPTTVKARKTALIWQYGLCPRQDSNLRHRLLQSMVFGDCCRLSLDVVGQTLSVVGGCCWLPTIHVDSRPKAMNKRWARRKLKEGAAWQPVRCRPARSLSAGRRRPYRADSRPSSPSRQG